MAGSLHGRQKLILVQRDQKKQEKKKEQHTKLQVQPDLEEVIERGVAIAAQGIFIFQVLENQRDQSMKSFTQLFTTTPPECF